MYGPSVVNAVPDVVTFAVGYFWYCWMFQKGCVNLLSVVFPSDMKVMKTVKERS